MLCRAVLQDSHNFGMGQALMARSNVAKTLLNKQHAPFRSLNRRGDKCLFSIKSGLLALSQLGVFRPGKSSFDNDDHFYGWAWVAGDTG